MCRSFSIDFGWYILGIALIGWTLLLLLAGERKRRMQEIDAKQKQIENLPRPKPAPDIPVVG